MLDCPSVPYKKYKVCIIHSKQECRGRFFMLGNERTYKNINPTKERHQNLYGSWYEKRLLVMRPASFSFSLSCCEAFLLSLRLNFLFSNQIKQNIYMKQQHTKFFTCSQLTLKKILDFACLTIVGSPLTASFCFFSSSLAFRSV